tara:strand:- start:42284 stop:42649 length:366 start_codon:yes stop_codon:yes gene_type:complete
MSAPVSDDLAARISAAKQALVIGEVAAALGLRGASRPGWECAACGSDGTVRERPDRKGARCSVTACNKGFDIVGMVMTAKGLSARASVTFLERVIAERDAKGDRHAPGLFDSQQGDANGEI